MFTEPLSEFPFRISKYNILLNVFIVSIGQNRSQLVKTARVDSASLKKHLRSEHHHQHCSEFRLAIVKPRGDMRILSRFDITDKTGHIKTEFNRMPLTPSRHHHQAHHT